MVSYKLIFNVEFNGKVWGYLKCQVLKLYFKFDYWG
jgi:hypothetical protein